MSEEKKKAPVKKVEENSEKKEESQGIKLTRNHYIGIVIVLAVVIAAFMLLPNNSEEPTQQTIVNVQNPAEVMARVNGQTVTREEVTLAAQALSAQTGGQQVSDSIALDNAITTELLVQTARNQGLSATEEEAEARINEVVASQGLTLEEVKADLELQGQSFDAVLKRYREQITVERLVDAVLIMKGEVTVSDAEAQAFYDANKEQLFLAGQEQPYEAIEADLKTYLEQEEQRRILQEYVLELRESADIQIYQ